MFTEWCHKVITHEVDSVQEEGPWLSFEYCRRMKNWVASRKLLQDLGRKFLSSTVVSLHASLEALCIIIVYNMDKRLDWKRKQLENLMSTLWEKCFFRGFQMWRKRCNFIKGLALGRCMWLLHLLYPSTSGRGNISSFMWIIVVNVISSEVARNQSVVAFKFQSINSLAGGRMLTYTAIISDTKI